MAVELLEAIVATTEEEDLGLEKCLDLVTTHLGLGG